MSITKQYVGRFAPSPTGPLHFGSLVAALASWLDARHNHGRWLVRIEDVDSTRCRAEWADTILRQLEALHLHWDGEVLIQSRRTARYEEALSNLKARGQLYACTCSRREIADSATAGIDGPIYPGTCRLKLVQPADAAIRVHVPAGELAFQDGIQGQVSQELARDIGDFVLKRRDGLIAYQLAVVVDDADQGVTNVVRGADLLDSTPRQIHLQRLLGFPACEYSHVPVAVNSAGQKLSKQTLAAAINPAEGAALLNQALGFLGQPIQPTSNPSDLLARAAIDWQSARIPRTRLNPAPAGWSD